MSQDPFRKVTYCHAPNQVSERLDGVDNDVIMLSEQILTRKATIDIAYDVENLRDLPRVERWVLCEPFYV